MSLVALLLACLGLVNAAFRQPAAGACEAQVDRELRGLARYYCRSQLHQLEGSSQSIGGTADEMGQMERLHEEVSSQIMPLSACAFGAYDYRAGALEKPLEVTPSEALRMMKACVAQSAMQTYVLTQPDASESYEPEDCVANAYHTFVANPISESRLILKKLDMEGMIAFGTKNICLNAVMSGFAREYVSMVALAAPPPEPGILDRMRGHRLNAEPYNMNYMQKGIEWVNLWVLLTRWDVPGAELKGWTLDKQPGLLFPLCTVYYVTH